MGTLTFVRFLQFLLMNENCDFIHHDHSLFADPEEGVAYTSQWYEDTALVSWTKYSPEDKTEIFETHFGEVEIDLL